MGGGCGATPSLLIPGSASDLQKGSLEFCQIDDVWSHSVVYLIASGFEAGGPCRKQADVLFLIDTTSNMDYDYFQRYMLGFVTYVIQQLDVDTGRTRVSVVSFSDNAQVRQISVTQSRTHYRCWSAGFTQLL